MSDYEEVDEQTEGEEPEVDQPEVEAEAPEGEPQEDVVTLSRSEYNAQAARLRIKEREARIQEDRLNQILAAIQQAAENSNKPQEEPEEEIDPNDTPAVIKAKQDQILKKIQAQEEKERQREAQAQAAQILQTANVQINTFASQDPELYTAGMTHLANVFKADLESRFPNKTERELVAMATQAVNAEKYKMVMDGEDVGQKLWERALIFGFDPRSYNQFRQSQGAGGKTKADPKEQIRTEKKKANSASIGAVPSAPPRKKINAREVRNMGDAEWRKTVNELMDSGQVRVHNKAFNSPSIIDLLSEVAGQ